MTTRTPDGASYRNRTGLSWLASLVTTTRPTPSRRRVRGSANASQKPAQVLHPEVRNASRVAEPGRVTPTCTASPASVTPETSCAAVEVRAGAAAAVPPGCSSSSRRRLWAQLRAAVVGALPPAAHEGVGRARVRPAGDRATELRPPVAAERARAAVAAGDDRLGAPRPKQVAQRRDGERRAADGHADEDAAA